MLNSKSEVKGLLKNLCDRTFNFNIKFQIINEQKIISLFNKFLNLFSLVFCQQDWKIVAFKINLKK